MKSKKVWAIFYRVRSSSISKWTKWTGPCGIYVVQPTAPPEIIMALRGRPFFFRTRRQARNTAKKLDQKSNITWTWVQHTVRPMTLTYKMRK